MPDEKTDVLMWCPWHRNRLERLEGEQGQTNATLAEHSVILGDLIAASKAGRGDIRQSSESAAGRVTRPTAPVPPSPPTKDAEAQRWIGVAVDAIRSRLRRA